MAETGLRGQGGRLGRIGGWAAMLAGLAFLANAAAQLDYQQLAGQLTTAIWWAGVLGAIVYALTLCLLARSWLELSAATNVVRWSLAVRIYGPAVIAKYLPGSIFQYASRQWRGAVHGLKHRTMASASILELVLHLGCAGAVAGMLLLPFGLLLPALGAVLAGAGLLFGARTRLRAMAFQMLFFLGFAALLGVLASFVPDFATAPVQPLVAMYLLAWLAGLLVPVAPGGIGVREAAWLALAEPFAAMPALAAFAILARLVSLAGDCLFGVAAYGVDWWIREKIQALG